MLTCPIPLSEYPHVLLAHGGGGRLMHQLIEKIFLTAFDNPWLRERHDAARLNIDRRSLCFTTDSYVVRPLFFPGGDIGKLSVYGTVNDLLMGGADPLYLSAGFILEEGLPMETLWRIALSMREAADRCGIRIVTGDTKVVDRGHGDGLYINTAGIGCLPSDQMVISPRTIRPGDRILLSGDVGRHGIAVLSVREGLEFEGAPESDCAPLTDLVSSIRDPFPGALHCLRDLTRGGLTAALNEIAQTSGFEMTIDEIKIPVHEGIQGACELLGLDPLYVACEGRFVAFISPDQADAALERLRSNPSGKEACIIGEVSSAAEGRVLLNSRIGSLRILDLPAGEQLPRIC